MFLPMARRGVGFDRDRLEDEVSRVNLAVRVRIRYADALPLVLERQHMIHFRPVAELAILLLPTDKQIANLVNWLLGKRRVVERAIANHARFAVGAPIAVRTARWRS